ncbi:hypothetical protein BGW38_006631, partial [Lunasporangiospora selenospora]
PPNLGLDVCVIEDDEDGLKEEGEETEDDNDEDDNDEYFSGTLHSNKHFYYADDENSRQPTDFSSTHSTSDQNRAKLLHVIREDDEEAEGSTRQSTQSTSADERSGGISVPQQEANHSRGGSSNSSRLKDADNQPMQGPSTATSLSRSESQSLPSLQRRPPSSASFTSNTSIRSVDDLLGSVKTDFDKRIQQAVQEVEQKVMERVQKLEERAVLVAAQSISRRASARTLRNSASFVSVNGVPHPTLSAGLTKDSAADRNDEDQPIGQEMTDSVDNTQRKDDLSNVTLKVGDLDSRINEMEVLVSYKLVDIESQVQGLQNGLQNGQNSIIESVDQTSNPHNQQDTTNGIDDLDEALSAEAVVRYNSQYQDEQETIQAVIDLRGELQELGARYHELNGGLLEDLMSQLREAKLFLFDSVDEADDRLSKRVDRIEAEMHAKMLTDIENRIQERVHAMEQTSTRLERCFDKMEGRLGILEAVLHAKRGPGTLTLMETLAQSSLNQEKQRQQDRALEQELQPQEQEKQQVQKLQKLTGTVIGFAPAGGLVPSRRADQHTATSLIFGTYDPTQESSAEEKRAQSTVGKQDSVRPLKVQSRSTLANIQSSPETPLPSAHGGPQDPKPTVPIWSTGPTPYPLPPPIHTASQQIPIRTAGRATDSQSRNSRAMTFGSLPTQSFLEGAYVSTESSTPPVIPPRPKRSMTSFNGAPTSPLTGTLTTKSNYIVVSGGSKSSTADKKVPRPSSSYKDLLHFWKAGGSTPDLLKPLPEPSSMPY